MGKLNLTKFTKDGNIISLEIDKISIDLFKSHLDNFIGTFDGIEYIDNNDGHIIFGLSKDSDVLGENEYSLSPATVISLLLRDM